MLRITELSFPGLGIGNFSVNSEAFSIFGISVAWYAVIITFGMICAIAYASVQAKKIGVSLDDICDFALWTIPIGIIGARLYFVLMSLEDFDSLGEVLNIRGGGLAIYGGIIGGALTVLVVSKVKKIDFLALADCVAPGVLLAQGIGRWGNFMNGEAFGAKTESFLRMGVQNIVSLYTFGTTEMVYVHPTFLYESLWNLLGVLLVYLYARYLHKKYDGELFIMTFGWYGLGRMFIEGLRMDSLYTKIFGVEFRTSQVLAATIFGICLVLYIYFAINKPKRPFFYKAVADGADEEKDNNGGETENFTDEMIEDSVDSEIPDDISSDEDFDIVDDTADDSEEAIEDIINDDLAHIEDSNDGVADSTDVSDVKTENNDISDDVSDVDENNGSSDEVADECCDAPSVVDCESDATVEEN